MTYRVMEYNMTYGTRSVVDEGLTYGEAEELADTNYDYYIEEEKERL